MPHQYMNVHKKSRPQILLMKNCKLHNTKVLFLITTIITTNVHYTQHWKATDLSSFTIISISVQKYASSTCSSSQNTLCQAH